MTLLPRDTLTRVFPNDPRAVGDFEALDGALSASVALLQGLIALANDAANRLQAIESATAQPHSTLLDAIAGVGDDVGAIEIVGPDQVAIRGIDTNDDACLVSRGQLVSYAGKGVTGSRPALSATKRAIYFDTTLAANGQPIFWTGSAWVKSDGSAA